MGGFKHAFEHLIPASLEWLQDMKAHQVEYDEAMFAKLDKSVQEELDKFDPKAVEEERDEYILRLIKDKRTAKHLV